MRTVEDSIGSDLSEETNLQFLLGSAQTPKKTMRRRSPTRRDDIGRGVTASAQPQTRLTSLNASVSEGHSHGGSAFKDYRGSSSFSKRQGAESNQFSRVSAIGRKETMRMSPQTRPDNIGLGVTASVQPLRTAASSVMHQQRVGLNGNNDFAEDASLHSLSVSSVSNQRQAGESLPFTTGNLAKHDELQSAYNHNTDKGLDLKPLTQYDAKSIVSEQSERPDGNGELNNADYQDLPPQFPPPPPPSSPPPSVAAVLNSAKPLKPSSQVQGVKKNSELQQEQARTARLKHFGVNQSSNGHGSGGGRQ